MTSIPRKTIGAWTVYERRPKPPGVPKYYVGTGHLPIKDFARYASAVRWCKEQRDKQSVYQTVVPPIP